MALKAILDSIDDLSEDLKSEYKEKKVGEKTVFVLDIEGFANHPDAAALKVALDRTKKDLKAAKDEKKALEDKIVNFPEEFTIDEWHRLQALDADDSEEGKKKKKTIEDERLATAKKNFETQINGLKKDLADLQTKYDNDINAERGGRATDRAETQLTEALTKAGVKPELLNGAKRLLRDNVKHEYDEDTKQLRVFVDTDMGEQEIGVYVESWIKGDEGKAYVAPASGGGAQGNGKQQQNQSSDNPFVSQNWNKTAQGRLMSANRPQAEKFAKAAGFASLEVAAKAREPIATAK
jgi:hypothetical protein